MALAGWNLTGDTGGDRKISNVVITITDNAAVAEGQTVIAVCNGKTFSSLIKNGVAKIYTSEVGTYTIAAGEYSTMLVCPYFGQFSTDIYSGVLKITCTEAGGNNKTCHVQSCDDEYNFTDSYNLTQTFDSGLVLTFMGIPTGMYLITVDDKYRFFKEIVSIQTVNESEVELKQWLYKDGDQCVHNTGGWMKCQINNSSIQSCGGGAILGKLSVSQSVNLLSSSIDLKHSSSASYGRSSGGTWGISRINCCLYVGTSNHNPIDVSKYSQIFINSTGNLVSTLRTGSLNSTTTTTATATVVTSGSDNVLNIQAAKETLTSIVIGKSYYNPGYGYVANVAYAERLDYGSKGSSSEVPASYTNSLNVSITQVYLV